MFFWVAGRTLGKGKTLNGVRDTEWWNGVGILVSYVKSALGDSTAGSW